MLGQVFSTHKALDLNPRKQKIVLREVGETRREERTGEERQEMGRRKIYLPQYTHLTPAIGKWKQENPEFKTSTETERQTEESGGDDQFRGGAPACFLIGCCYSMPHFENNLLS